MCRDSLSTHLQTYLPGMHASPYAPDVEAAGVPLQATLRDGGRRVDTRASVPDRGDDFRDD